jgi:peptidoglycan/xylan/chitin deacetylase (PgdA/CDA1 family)
VALAALAAVALVLGGFVGAGRGRPPRERGQRMASAASAFAASPRAVITPEQADENVAVDRTLAITPYVRIAGSQHREAALTFDDGPGPYTPKILAILWRARVPATFFEVGILETYFHASTSAIVERGYPVGDHTESLLPMGRLSPRAQRRQLLEQVSATGAYGATFPRMFRPPYGSWDRTTLRLLRRYGMLMVLWSVDTNDYRRPGVAAIVRAAVTGARPGAIILLHDGGGDRSETVAALPTIIRRLRGLGYALVTVPKLLLDNPPAADQDVSGMIGSGG